MRNSSREVNEEITMKEEVTSTVNRTIIRKSKILKEVAVACNENTVVDTITIGVIANATSTQSLYLTTTEKNAEVEVVASSQEVVAVELASERKEITEVHAQVEIIYHKNS